MSVRLTTCPLVKWLIDQMSFGELLFLTECYSSKFPLDQISFGDIHPAASGEVQTPEIRLRAMFPLEKTLNPKLVFPIQRYVNRINCEAGGEIPTNHIVIIIWYCL